MAGTNKNRLNISQGPVIVLVEPQLPENIGMVARAMANFGLAELRIVNPREVFPSDKAIAAASKANHIIANTVVFPSLRDAVRDLSYLYATTARRRDGYKTVLGPAEAMAATRQRALPSKTGILFGRERWGLTNEEISLADEIVTFPVNPAFASLNIAQAVLLMSYEWMRSGLAEETDTAFRGPALFPAPKQALYGLFAQLEEALDVRGYFRPKERKEVMVNNLRAVFTRLALSDAEIKLLRGVISSLDHFTRSLPRGSGSPEARRRTNNPEVNE